MYFSLILLIVMTYSCSDVFIAPTGDQNADGCSQDSPTTFTKAFEDRRNLGGRILFLPGRYENFDNEVVSGSEITGAGSLVFEPANDGEVIIDGSRSIETLTSESWEEVTGTDMYTISGLSADIWQLFEGEKMLMNARWPEVSKHFFDDWNVAYTGRNPEPGTVWDVSSAWAAVYVDSIDDGEATLVISSLPSTFGNLEGATVHLDKCGSARTVISHTGNTITVTAEACVSNSELIYLENHISLLDSPREWFYDSGVLTIWPENAPAGNVRGRTIDRVLKFYNFRKQEVVVRGLKFFAGLVTGKRLTSFTFEDVTFQYPSFPKSMIGDFTEPGFMDFSWDPSFINCKIQYYWNIGLKIWTRSLHTGTTFENNLIEYGGAYLSGDLGYALKLRRFGKAVVRRNTIQYHARGGGIEGSSFSDDHANLYELNLIQHISVIHWEDVGCIHLQIRQQKRSFISRNWFLHSGIIGARFDAPQSTIPIDELGFHGSIIYNVGYDLWHGVMIKGSYHMTVGNTMSSVSPRNAFTIVNEVGDTLVNTNSGTYNNMGSFISGARKGAYPEIPGPHGGNARGYEINDDLRNPAGFDFRLKEGSSLHGAGTLCVDMFTDVSEEHDPCYRAFGEGPYTEDSHVKRIDWSFLRDGAPNVGAYQRDDEYWVPGRQTEAASFPIPSDNAFVAPSDLMFRQGRNSIRSHVYLGASETSLEFVGTLEGSANIYSVSELVSDTPYFWRIDSELADGTIVSSDVWKFTTVTSTEPEEPEPEENYSCLFGCDELENRTCKNTQRIAVPCQGGSKCNFDTCKAHCDANEECRYFFSNAHGQNNGRGGCMLYSSCEKLRNTPTSGETMQKL